jgi:gliding motility-associated lipoprotein GldH
MLLASCNSNVVFEASENFTDNTWSATRTATFEVENIDTLNTYDINIVLRNTNDYEFSSIYMITEIKKPNKTIETDTLEYLMANPNGSWLGTGNAVKENWLAYKHNYTFDSKGTYTIAISQANRKNGTVNGVKNLKGITDIGIQITKNN